MTKQVRNPEVGAPTTGGMTPKDPSLVGKETEPATDPGLPTSGGLTPKHAPPATKVASKGTAPAPKKVVAPPPAPAKRAAVPAKKTGRR